MMDGNVIFEPIKFTIIPVEHTLWQFIQTGVSWCVHEYSLIPPVWMLEAQVQWPAATVSAAESPEHVQSSSATSSSPPVRLLENKNKNRRTANSSTLQFSQSDQCATDLSARLHPLAVYTGRHQHNVMNWSCTFWAAMKMNHSLSYIELCVL